MIDSKRPDSHMERDYKIFISDLSFMFLTYDNSSAMGFWNLILHLGNFALPALVMAALLAPAVAGWRSLTLRRLWFAWWLLAGAGLLVLVAGLVVLGRDGRMVSYAALVLIAGSLACWLQRRGAPVPAAPRARHTRPVRR